jgi:hypothetical protein
MLPEQFHFFMLPAFRLPGKRSSAVQLINPRSKYWKTFGSATSMLLVLSIYFCNWSLRCNLFQKYRICISKMQHLIAWRRNIFTLSFIKICITNKWTSSPVIKTKSQRKRVKNMYTPDWNICIFICFLQSLNKLNALIFFYMYKYWNSLYIWGSSSSSLAWQPYVGPGLPQKHIRGYLHKNWKHTWQILPWEPPCWHKNLSQMYGIVISSFCYRRDRMQLLPTQPRQL